MTDQKFYTLFYFGDSITWGMTDRQGGWPKRCSEKMRFEIAGRADLAVMDYALGIPGNATPDLLMRFEDELKSRQMMGWHTICLFAIGMNDCQYMIDQDKCRTSHEDFLRHIQKLVDLAHQNDVSDICFIGLNPVDEKRTLPMPGFQNLGFCNEDIAAKNSILRQFCADREITFVDVWEDWQNADVTQLLDDGLHPNDAGHERMCHQIYDLILKPKFQA